VAAFLGFPHGLGTGQVVAAAWTFEQHAFAPDLTQMGGRPIFGGKVSNAQTRTLEPGVGRIGVELDKDVNET
jgi:hypothetical protein